MLLTSLGLIKDATVAELRIEIDGVGNVPGNSASILLWSAENHYRRCQWGSGMLLRHLGPVGGTPKEQSVSVAH